LKQISEEDTWHYPWTVFR